MPTGLRPRVFVAYERDRDSDRRRGEWLEEVLLDEEFQIYDWNEIGRNRYAVEDEAIRARPPLLVVVGEEPYAENLVALALAGSREATIVPVVFGDRDPDGVLAGYNAIRLTGLQQDVARAELLRGLDGIVARVTAPPRRANWIAQDLSGSLPQLRALSGRAHGDAGQAGLRHFRDLLDAAGTRLYVRRDVEQKIVDAMATPGPPIVVSGPAGSGKTSLLWGIASTLLEQQDHDVFFVKASWLAAGTQGITVSADDVRAAVAGVHSQGRSASLLVDTADLLVNDDQSFVNLDAVVQAAVDARIPIVITSRPAEAFALQTDADRRFVLGDYSTSAIDGDVAGRSDTQGASEFRRAVRSHALAYCRFPGDTGELAERLIEAVVRRQPLERLSRHPLTLRLLFQLYAPGRVPADIDATQLYEEFWRDRVFRDRREWTHAGAADLEAGRDLTNTASRLALEMLRRGLPEVRVVDVVADDESATVKVRSDVQLLVERGVGSLDDSGTFAFLHQTFFEFAAARALLHRAGAHALTVLLLRARERPTDHLLLAVLEQALLCAMRSPSTRAAAAAEVAALLVDITAPVQIANEHEDAAGGLSVLATDAAPRGTAVAESRFALTRLALLVVAQGNGIPDALYAVAAAALASTDSVDLSTVRDVLALLPGPGRGLTDQDLLLISACASRGDPSRDSILAMVSRLAESHPDVALHALAQLRLDRALHGMGPKQLAGERRLPSLLAEVSGEDPDAALEVFASILDAGRRARSSSFVAGALESLSISRLPAERAVKLADIAVQGLESTGELVRAHTEVHCLLSIETSRRPGGWQALLTTVSNTAMRISRRRGTARSDASDRASFAASVMAFAGECEGEDLVALTDVLRGISDPKVHATLHRGCLVPLLASDRPEFESAVVDILVAGLPAPHMNHHSDGQRWADTLRRTLERPDLPDAVVTRIADRVVSAVVLTGTAAERLWLDEDYLLRLAVRCASAGNPVAQSALQSVTTGRASLAPAGWRVLLQAMRSTAGNDSVLLPLLRLLIEEGRLPKVEQLLVDRPDVRLDVDTALLLREAAQQGLSAHEQNARRAGVRLLAIGVRENWWVVPEWELARRWLQVNGDAVVRAELIGLMAVGLERGAYDFKNVEGVLTPLAAGSGVEKIDEDRRIGADTIAARRTMVKVLAQRGLPHDVRRMLDLGFRDPVDGGVIATISAYLRSDERNGASTPLGSKIDVVIEVGCRLARSNVTGRARRDTPSRWRSPLSDVLRRAPADEQLRVLAALSEMDPYFAAFVADYIVPWHDVRVRQKIAALASDASLDGQVLRRLNFSLKKAPPQGSASWWELDDDLAAVTTSTHEAADTS